MKYTKNRCIRCDELFSNDNTHTEAGWRETQISGLCEDCFDEVTAEQEDDCYPYEDDIDLDEDPF